MALRNEGGNYLNETRMFILRMECEEMASLVLFGEESSLEREEEKEGGDFKEFNPPKDKRLSRAWRRRRELRKKR